MSRAPGGCSLTLVHCEGRSPEPSPRAVVGALETSSPRLCGHCRERSDCACGGFLVGPPPGAKSCRGIPEAVARRLQENGRTARSHDRVGKEQTGGRKQG